MSAALSAPPVSCAAAVNARLDAALMAASMLAGPGGFQSAEDAAGRLVDACSTASPTDVAHVIARLANARAGANDALHALYLGSLIAHIDDSGEGLAAFLTEALALPVQAQALILQSTNASLRARLTPAANTARHALYHRLVETLAAHLPLPAPIPAAERDEKVVIFLTQQFLTRSSHAPTRDVLFYAQLFAEEFAKTPVIISSNQFAMGLCAPVHKPFIGARMEQYDAITGVEHAGLTFPYRQIQHPMPHGGAIAHMLALIAALKPALVIGHGATNYVADLCAHFTQVVSHQTTAALDPFRGGPTLLCRPPSADDLAALAGVDQPADDVIVTRAAVRLPAITQPMTRADLGLDTDQVAVGVVGNRLDTELSPAFLGALDAACARAPQIAVRTAGRLTRGEAVFAPYPHLAKAARHTGYQSDLRAFTQHMDLWANPPRVGGGTSAAMALDAGAAVVTLPGGDVAEVAGPDWHVADLPALTERLVSLALDPALRAQAALVARQRAEVVQDVTGMWRDALHALQDYTERRRT